MRGGMQDHSSKRRWEEFQALGQVRGALRDLILASWQRSAHILPNRLDKAPMLQGQELDDARRHSSRFLRAATPAARTIDRILYGSGNMILICDPDGVVVDQFGDPEIVERGHENNLFTGGRWSEDDIGTNAIGIAMRTGRAVQVLGAEHYSEEIHRWSCSATPVRDPVTGQILGIINMSWPAEVTRSAVTALSASLAHQAEAALRQQLTHEHMLLAEIGQQRRIGRGRAPMMLLDRHGRAVLTAGLPFDAELDEALGRPLSATLPEMLDTAPEQLEELLSGLGTGLDIEVIRDGDSGIGLLLGKGGGGAARRRLSGDLDHMAAIGPVMHDLGREARSLAKNRLPLVIEGEAGVGKSTLAFAIHAAGPDSDRLFETLDCVTLTPDRLRAELDEGGLVERLMMRGGTLCLDRPNLAPEGVQALLPALLEQLEMASDVRVITLASVSLYEAMSGGQFPGDLYFRLAGARLVIPPLRERRDEIMPSLRLIEQRKFPDKRRLDFTAAAEERLIAYHWPGNLRQMGNLVRLLQATDPKGRIDQQALPQEFRETARPGGRTLRDTERDRIAEALRKSGGNMTEAARRLGIARSTLYLKIDAYGITRPSRG